MSVDVTVDVYPRKQTTAMEFALMLEKCMSASSGILYGATISVGSASEVNISEGWALVRGRICHISSGTHSIEYGTIVEETTKYILLEVDLENTEETGKILDDTEIPSDTENFNVVNGKAYCNLGAISVTSAGVQSATPHDPIVPTYDLDRVIYTETIAPTDNQGADGDIWFVYNA